MSKNMPLHLAGRFGGAAMALASQGQCQDYTPIPSSERWKVMPEQKQGSLIYPAPPYGNRPLGLKPVITLEKEFRVGRNTDISLKYQTETGGGLKDILTSGSLPFTKRSETGGQWDLKVKSGAAIQYKYRF